jgi:ADP-ribose pyrophosphatase YjhB (NUDIX family)
VSALSGWRFCPRDATELLREVDHLLCPACGERYWANSVPGAQVVLERDGRVLLGRRRNGPGAGRWDLPGGFLHEGEDALEGLRREVREETALELEPIEFLGTWNESYQGRFVLCLTWLGRAEGGQERPGDDLVELAWFSADDRPRDGELAFPTFEEILTLWGARRAPG